MDLAVNKREKFVGAGGYAHDCLLLLLSCTMRLMRDRERERGELTTPKLVAIYLTANLASEPFVLCMIAVPFFALR